MRKSPHPVDVFVGRRLRMARLEKGLSQESVAGDLGLTFQQLQKYEKGSNRISASRLAQLSKILDKPVSWFFDDEHSRAKDGDLLTQLIVTPGGARLAQAFLTIKDSKKRTAALHVIEALAA